MGKLKAGARKRTKTKRRSSPVRARAERHRGGRPTKYSRTVTARICRAVRKGCSREAAAGLAGIAASTFYAWQRDFPQFSEDLKRADAQFEQSSVTAIQRAGRKPRNWAANAWLLERKFPERWGKVDRHLLRVRRDEDLTQLPQEAINAINRALGVTGKLIPIGTPPLLTDGNGDGEIDTEILPQD